MLPVNELPDAGQGMVETFYPASDGEFFWCHM
jgi:hypothetical protein